MSIDSTTKSSIYRKKTMKPTLSQSDNHPYSRNLLKNHQQRSHSMQRTTSSTEEISGDILTDLSSAPYMTNSKISNKRNRRYSELKPSHIKQVQATHSERRNSASQINFSALLPNPFRSNKHYKNLIKDETNTTPNSNSSPHYNDMMTMKTELPSSMKLSNSTFQHPRTNSLISYDQPSSFTQDDSRSYSISSVTSSFMFDPNQLEACSAEILKLELHTPICVGEDYRHYFLEHFHTNYCGEFDPENPFIASLRYFYTKPVEGIDGICQARAIIRTPHRNDVVSTIVNGTNEDNILQILFNQANLPTIQTYKPIGDPKANQKIYLFDKLNDERHNCKIGLIYQRSDQTLEYDIYSNDFLSIDLLDFLQMLAERVRLKGFNKYRGDLDIKDDLNGEYSYYVHYKNHEIMFNIAPIIPSTKTNGQCIERKGLVGNAFVCIVFQEPNAEFSPELISGKVTQIYITVQPNKINEQVYYKIGIWHRSDVTQTIDPSGGMYLNDHAFKDYFLTLLLNSVNVAIESPSLRCRIAQQRQRLKREELKKLAQALSIGQILNLSNDVENINCNVDQQFNNVSNSTLDNSIPTSGRTKRGFSKIFNVFSSRQNSFASNTPSPTTSHPPAFPNFNMPSLNPPSPDINTIQTKTVISSNREPMKRTTSAGRPAPPPPPSPAIPIPTLIPPPIPPRNPVSKSVSISSIQPSANDTKLSQNTNELDEPSRNRSNSSPGNSSTATKPPSSTVSSISEEIDNSSSLGDDDFDDDEFSDDNKNDHRATLTASSIILPPNLNS
ncbi:unnamed protein product [Adineta steineri]|uniref:Rap-GAP domain-containing protein n=1 Tax=Adineta steineri TaxID=433720 RepID=A0A815CNC9_9BILA|nr:unnamed protein product [Adineta steineri]